jgi:UDP-glucose 4-epimerase
MILLTGATGYIGSHTWVELIQQGYEVIGIDNLSNSDERVISRIEEITGQSLRFIRADVRNYSEIHPIFKDSSIDAVIHLAGLKSVANSVKHPIEYYENNVLGLVSVLKAMRESSCRTFIFSSSATVYSPNNPVPYQERMVTLPTTPYGKSKLVSEEILFDYHQSCPDLSVANLRYFNPVGAHPTGLIGENPLGVPNNLMPFLTSVASKKRGHLEIFGNDWPTKDGTGVRDYIHVVDLVKGHIKALKYISEKKGFVTVNLGTGRGVSVLELVHTFEKVNSIKLPVQFVSRRSGDIAEYYSDPSLAKEILGWEAQLTLESMCQDSWNWASKNPNGYL